MSKIAAFIGAYVNGGTALLLMGAQWLYLWLVPWYGTFTTDPQWGHNFVMSLAFIGVGLAYYHRRLASDLLAILAAALTLPANIESLPTDWTTVFSAVLLLLIFLDMLTEVKKPYAWFSSTNAKLSGWLERYLLCLAFLLLACIPIIYFAIRLPGGTYDSGIDTLLFDALLIPFMVFLLMDRMTAAHIKPYYRLAGFFWGMLTMVAVLALVADQPETWPNLVFSIVITLIGAVVVWINMSGLQRGQADRK